MHAGVLVAHGLSDWNVKTTQAAQWYEALKAAGVPHRIYWHQGGHGGDPPLDLQVRWFTHFLFGRDNGVEHGKLAWIQRENGSLVKYADWPDPADQQVTMSLTPRGDHPTGGLHVAGADGATGPSSSASPTLPTLTAAALAAAPDSPHGRVYVTDAARPTTCGSAGPRSPSCGCPSASTPRTSRWRSPTWLRMARVTRLVTEGWRDPQNRDSLSRTEVVHPGVTYSLSVPMEANDYVFAAGSPDRVRAAADRPRLHDPAAGRQQAGPDDRPDHARAAGRRWVEPAGVRRLTSGSPGARPSPHD